jgi:hypothetical protein
MSKELEYEINNFANLLHKDCMNLMECLKKQSEDNKPILYLGKHYQKVILPYEEYQKMCNRLEEQEKKTYSDELKLVENKLKALDLLMQELDCKDFAELRKYARCGYEKLKSFKGSNEFKIEIPESSLMNYNPTKQYLKWEDLEFKEEEQTMKVLLNGKEYMLSYFTDGITEYVDLLTDGEKLEIIGRYVDDSSHEKQFFNDLHLERVEE